MTPKTAGILTSLRKICLHLGIGKSLMLGLRLIIFVLYQAIKRVLDNIR